MEAHSDWNRGVLSALAEFDQKRHAAVAELVGDDTQCARWPSASGRLHALLSITWQS